MSYENGMAALQLEFTDRVPRTEYSAHMHWKLVQAVTGLSVDEHSTYEQQTAASAAFMRAWDYGMNWNVGLHSLVFGEFRASMGHAVYAAGGVDFNTATGCRFEDEEAVLAYVAEKYGKTHVIVGNADTRCLLRGQREEIYGEVKRCMDTAKHCPGFIMAVGNHIPPNTPVDAALYYDEVYRKLGRR